MNGLASWIYQIVMVLVATFLFMVLFEHGTSQFAKNAGLEFSRLVNFVTGPH